jgi:hypothetical protein
MIRFLGNDFTQERWKSAALKNAYALLGKQRFEYAVAFFLLADRIGDAVDICVKRLNDTQLALVLCRIYLGESSELFDKVLMGSMLPDAIRRGDRWLMSISFSLLRDKENALKATFMPLDSFGVDRVSTTTFIDPALVLLYTHLIKHYKSLRMDEFTLDIWHQVDLISKSAYTYDRLGCPALALRILDLSLLSSANLEVESGDSGGDLKGLDSNNGGMDWGEPVNSQPFESNSGGMDWGEPVSVQPAVSNGIDWGEPVSNSGGIDWSEPASSGAMDWGEPSVSKGIDFGEFKSTLDTETMSSEMLDSKLDPEKDTSTYRVDQATFDRLCVQRNHLGPYRRQLAIKVIQV